MAAGSVPEGPENDKWYSVRLGDTVFDNSRPLYSTVRYDFKPASIDFALPGTLRRNSSNHEVTVEHRNKQPGKPPAVYQGHGEPCQDLDFILVFDGKNFTLEKLHETTVLKKDRSSGGGKTALVAAGGGIGTSAAADAQPSPPLQAGSEATPTSSTAPALSEDSLKAPDNAKGGGKKNTPNKIVVKKKPLAALLPQKNLNAVIPDAVPKSVPRKRGRPPKAKIEEKAEEEKVEYIEVKKQKVHEEVKGKKDKVQEVEVLEVEEQIGGDVEFDIEEFEEIIEEVEEEVEEDDDEGGGDAGIKAGENNVAALKGGGDGLGFREEASGDKGGDSGSSGSGSDSGSSGSKDSVEQDSDDDSSGSSGDE